MPDEGWGSDAVDSSAPATRHMNVPAPVDPAVLAERAAAKKAKKAHKAANAASVEAIARRVAAEAVSAAQDANMIIAVLPP